MSACGDLNGDGATDLCVETSPTSSDVSQAAILFGPLTPGLIDFATSRSVVLNADPTEHALDAGDVDGDGIDDLVVGAPLDSARSSQAGAVHLFLGGALPF